MDDTLSEVLSEYLLFDLYGILETHLPGEIGLNPR